MSRFFFLFLLVGLSSSLETYKIGTKSNIQTVHKGETTLLTWQTSSNSENFSSFNIPVPGFYYVHLSCSIEGRGISTVILRSLIRNIDIKAWNFDGGSVKTLDVSAIIHVGKEDIDKDTDFSWYIHTTESVKIFPKIIVDTNSIESSFYEFYLLTID